MSTLEYNREYYTKNREIILKQKKEERVGWSDKKRVRDREAKRRERDRNREKYSRYMREWRLNNPEKLKAHLRKFNYGITEKEFNDKLILQNNKCAICCNDFTKTPHVDHDHATHKFRDLLCSDCNLGLGRFKDSVRYLDNAIQYLLKHEGLNESRSF